MEINSIQNSHYPINTNSANSTNSTNNISREKKTTEDSTTSHVETYGTDTVDISSNGSFKAKLGTYSKTFEAHSKQAASQERIEELKTAYTGDNCPVSGVDIASAIAKYALGTTGQK